MVWFGLGLGYVMVCEVTLVCVQVRSVILIKELARGADRIRSLMLIIDEIFARSCSRRRT